MEANLHALFQGTDIFQKGFLPLHIYEQWRIMSSSVDQQERPVLLQKHEKTDEVFCCAPRDGPGCCLVENAEKLENVTP